MATIRKTKPAASTDSSKPAVVQMAVTEFIDVLAADSPRAGRSTGYAMKLIGKPSNVKVKGDTIYIKPPRATIRFLIVSASKDKETYYPIGITYLREGQCASTVEQRLGLLNFPQRKMRLEGLSLTITDSYKDREKNVRYKFSIVVQRGSDGSIGIIDPGIVHEDEN